MNKMVVEILKIQNELLDDLVNTWNPMTREKFDRAKKLIDILENGLPDKNHDIPESVKKRIDS